MSELLAHLDTLAEGARAMLWAGFLVFVRVGAMMALLPAFGEQMVPPRVRLAVTLAFTAVVAPTVFPMLPEAPGPVAMLAEAVVGLMLGAGLRLLVHGLQTAGTMAAQATSLAQILGGAGVDPQPAMARVLVVAGLALAVAAGLHVRAAELLILSYDMLPAGRFPAAEDAAQLGVAQVARAFALAFSLAAPFLIGSLVYNVALGVINRAMPQLMVAFIGAPALTAGGLILLAVLAPVMLTIWMQALAGQLAAPLSVPR